jgi:hypothetical protein
LSIRSPRTQHARGIFLSRDDCVKTYWQKSSPFAWTPVKYAKFFAERYVAQEIAIL